MDQEDKMGSFSFSKMIHAFSYAPRIFQMLWKVNRLHFIGIVVLTIMQGLAPTTFVLATQVVINRIVQSWESGFHVMVGALLIFGVVMVVNEVCNILRVYVEKIFEVSLSYHVDCLIMEKAATLSLSDFENHEIQDQIKRVQNESKFRFFQVFKQIMTVLSGVVTMLSSAAVIFCGNGGRLY